MKDSNGHPFVNAYVQLVGESYQAITSNYTDENGKFDIVYKDQGNFTITVDHSGLHFVGVNTYSGPMLQNRTINPYYPF